MTQPVSMNLGNAWLVRVLMFALLSVCSPSGVAQTWSLAATSTSGDQYHIDRSSVRTEAGINRAWIRIDFAKPKYNDGRRAYYNQELRSVAVNCSARTYALAAYVERNRAGDQVTVVQSHSNERHAWKFQEYPPGSIGDQLVREICDGPQRALTQTPIRRVMDRVTSADWDAIGSFDSNDEGSVVVEVDRRTISTLTNDRSISAATVRLTPESRARAGYRSQLMELFFNCGARTWALSAFIKFDEPGSVLSQEDIPTSGMKYGSAPANSLAADVMAYVCGNRHSQASPQPAEPSQPTSGGFGTGWLSENGYVITAHHVIDQATRIFVLLKDKRRVPAKVVTVDAANDIAVLDVNFGASRPRGLQIAKSPVGLGARVFTLGFPHPTLMGLSPKLTAGEVSSVAGLRDDPRVMQISVPVQSGNSGGPLMNQQGEVVGVVSAKLSATNVLRTTGDLTQNVNYAIKGRYVSGLLSDIAPRPVAAVSTKPNSLLEAIVSQVQDSIFVIIAE